MSLSSAAAAAQLDSYIDLSTYTMEYTNIVFNSICETVHCVQLTQSKAQAVLTPAEAGYS